MKSARLLQRLAQPLSRPGQRNRLRSFTTVSSRTSAAAASAVQPQHPYQPSFPAPGHISAGHDAPAPPATAILHDAVSATRPRNNWTRDEIAAIYGHTLMDLVHQAVRSPIGGRPPYTATAGLSNEACYPVGLDSTDNTSQCRVSSIGTFITQPRSSSALS